MNRYIAANQTLLDVGCGPGLYRKTTPARFIGIDYTDAPYYPDWPRDVDVVAEGSMLPLRSGCVDLVMSKSAFFQFPQPDEALRDFFRVLRPGGRILLFDYNRRTQRHLERGENSRRPCWTQWQLRDRVRAAGFTQVELLLPMSRQLPAALRLPFLIAQELFGSWAIVTGIRPK
ncbi:MAG: class I SAM-dependent methyltransferase [Pseudomonadota bacterium]|nr:class I SAM-dependent methyltransferase [Pseudomonadota bacterium]